MTGRAARSGPRRSTLRRVLLGSTPLLVGALVLGLALAHPASPARGDAFTGPKVPSALAPPPLGADLRVSWTAGHRGIALRVRDGAACRPPRPRETSTAPARIEVTLVRPHGTACSAKERWWRFALAPPTVAEPGQSVAVWVDGRKGSVPRYLRPTAGAAES